MEENKINKYWDTFYRLSEVTNKPSPFAVYCSENYIKPNKHILELGCGNGRDSNHFAKIGCKVTAADFSEGVYNIKGHTKENPMFINNNAVDVIRLLSGMDYVYMRWFLHAIKKEDEKIILQESYKRMKRKGLIFIEVRSVNDHLYGKGEKISKTEYVDTHYRRFFKKEELISDLKKIGFNIIYNIEDKGFSKNKDNDPTLIRIVAQK
tara:strand:+ start:320 stop:943 length:624 start_codon:yes stop_codon:yes gene_type:complete